MSEEPPIAESSDGTQQTPAVEPTASSGSGSGAPPTTVAPTGKRQAFRDLRRQLEDGDLASPGVQKMLLEAVERADSECEILQGYVERYHEADKLAAVLQERLRTSKAIDVMFGVGVGLGGSIMGLAPLWWKQQPQGVLALAVGILLVVGATAGRLVKR